MADESPVVVATRTFGVLLRLLGVGAPLTEGVSFFPGMIFENGQLEIFERPTPQEVTVSLGTTHTVEEGQLPPLSTRQKLALASLAGDDRAASAALADHMLEEGVDYGEAAYERGLAEGRARERERVRVAASDFIRDFRRLTIGTGTRSATDQAYIQHMENTLLELAGLLASGQPYDRWEAERRAEQFRQEYEARFISRESFLGAAMYQPTMDAILQGLGIPPEVYNPPGGVEIVGNNRAWTGEGPT